MASDPTKAWHKVFTSGSKQMQDRLKAAHGNKPEFQNFLKSIGAEGGERSAKQSMTSLAKANREKIIAAAAKKIELKKSSERVRAMRGNADQFGGGLGGGLERNADIIRHVRSGGTLKVAEEVEQIDERNVENKKKKDEYVRLQGLKAMKAGKVDPARGHSPTRFGREELKNEEVELEESMTDSWKNVQSMPKGSVTGGKEEIKQRHAYLTALYNHHKKYGNDTKKVKGEIERLNRSRIAEENLDEATPYYNKSSFLKKMSRLAKQERQAREKKETEQKKKVNEVSSELLDRYKEKAKKSADELSKQGKYRQSNDRIMNVMKATGKQIEKTTANIKKSLNKEENDIEEAANAAQQAAIAIAMKKAGKKPKNLDEDTCPACGKNPCECECETQEDELNVKIGDTGKLTYDQMKRFLGIQDVHKLAPEDLKAKGIPVSPSELILKHQRMQSNL